MIISHNFLSLNAANIIGDINTKKNKSTEKLSSGYKINRAADNAAGLAISEKMRRQIRGLTQASENAQDGISLCQIADGALEESSQMVHRLKELSIKAANGTNSESDRASIQAEVSKLVTEIDRISETTVFNDQRLLNGDFSTGYIEDNIKIPLFYQKENETYKNYDLFRMVDVSQISSPGMLFSTKVSGRNLYVSVNEVVDPSAQTTAEEKVNSDKLTDTLVRSIVPQAVNSLFNTLPTLKAAYDKGYVSDYIGLRIYKEPTSTLASVTAWFDQDRIGSGISLGLSVNTNTLKYENGNLTNASRTALEATILHEMIHAFMDDVTINGMLGFNGTVKDADEKFPDWFVEGFAQTVSGGFEGNYGGWVGSGDPNNIRPDYGLGIKPGTPAEDIKKAVTDTNSSIENNTTSVSSYGTGYLAVMYLGYLASGGGSVSASKIASGLNTILNKLMNGYSLDDTINTVTKGQYSGINSFQNKFGDDASVDFVHNLAVVSSGGNGAITGSLNQKDLLPDGTMKGTAYQLVPTTQYYGSTAITNLGSGGKTSSGSNVINFPDGLIAIFAPNNTGSNFEFNPYAPEYRGGTVNMKNLTWTPGGYESAKKGVLSLHVGADANNKLEIHIDEMSAKALGLNGVSVSTIKGALEASNAADIALSRITANRARIGAYVNRLEHTIKNLDNVVENTQAAESVIRDTDMAAEMVTFSKSNILIQAGTAMLTQANQTPQGVMALLG